MDKDKTLRHGLFYLGLAIVAAIFSGTGQSDVVTIIWFICTVGFAFMAYVYLIWER